MASIRVVAGFIERNGEVLFAQRPPGKARAGFWELPGGKVEPGESDASALRRELEEELGVWVEVGEALGSNVHRYHSNLEIELHLYRARLRQGTEPAPREGQALRWGPLAAVDEAELCEADRPLVRRLRSLND